MEISYGEIVPQDIQDALIMLRDQASVTCWGIGDLSEEVINLAQANGLSVNRGTIFAAVGSFCGKAARTVREYHQVSRDYQPWIREKYAVLSFDHFRTASRLGYYTAALDWAVSQVDELNRPATVDAMEAKYKESRKVFEEETTQELSPAEVYILTIVEDLHWARGNLSILDDTLNADEWQIVSDSLETLAQIFEPYAMEIQSPNPENTPLTTAPAGV